MTIRKQQKKVEAPLRHPGPTQRAVDDEPVTEEDRRRFQEGQAWFAQRDGKGIPMEDVLADFGLKLQDFPLKPDLPKRA